MVSGIGTIITEARNIHSAIVRHGETFNGRHTTSMLTDKQILKVATLQRNKHYENTPIQIYRKFNL